MTIQKSGNSRSGNPYAQNQGMDIKAGGFAELIPVISGNIGGNECAIVSAKALHTALGVGRDFTNWIKGRVTQYGFVDGGDYVVVENLSTPKLASAKSRQQKAHDYLVSLNMAKELAMVERNDQGRAVRRYFIQCEERLQAIAPKVTKELRQQLKARLNAANYFKPMCAALELARREAGKPTLPHHYTTESNMISRLVLAGMTSKQWAKASGAIGNPRDSMSAEQLEHLSYLEQSNITLIELGWDYHQRKGELIRLSQRWLAKRLEVAQ